MGCVPVIGCVVKGLFKLGMLLTIRVVLQCY
jgi:hypothetical protein